MTLPLEEYRKVIPEVFPLHPDWPLWGKVEQQMQRFSPEEWATFKKVLRLPHVSVKPEDFGHPPKFFSLKERFQKRERWNEWREQGKTFAQNGTLAFLTVAGGQGTRLGVHGPKGMIPITPVKRKTLFQLFAEKILSAERAMQTEFHWFLMTSPDNHEATKNYFQQTKIFPLHRLHLFPQGDLPVFDLQGQCLRTSTGELIFAPDGHGGVFRALHRNGCLDLMSSLNIITLSYFQIDNPLAIPLDLGFLGWHLRERAEMSSKAVRKRHSNEKVGVFVASPEGRTKIIEYSDIPAELTQKTDSRGQPLFHLFHLGNTALHLLERQFIERILESGNLPFHVARKTVLDKEGNALPSGEPNALKLERFVFDALPLAHRSTLLEVDRREEFSPVKNATQEDSIESARHDQVKRFKNWLKRAGARIPFDDGEISCLNLEIAPSFADEEEEFLDRWSSLSVKPEIRNPFYLAE
jgi:UDP-N-acetylglucosamine/UDP-N-acetylgalactosamine diphosphorylase